MNPDYEAQIAAEVLSEVEQSDPIKTRFTYVIFISHSKGRTSKGRKRQRKRISEVELISDKQERARRFYSWDRFPFDTKGSDVYGDGVDGLEAEARLMREIPMKAKRV